MIVAGLYSLTVKFAGVRVRSRPTKQGNNNEDAQIHSDNRTDWSVYKSAQPEG